MIKKIALIKITKNNKAVLQILISVILFWGLFSFQATAASFDCKKASTWLEKTICANPELSKLDEQMAKAYSDALKILPPEGQKETKEYQRKWLKNLNSIKKSNEYYTKNKENAKYRDFHINTDMHIAYEERIKQLQNTLIKFSDRVFRNIYISHPKTETNCLEKPTKKVDIEKYLSYPQIVNPRDEN